MFTVGDTEVTYQNDATGMYFSFEWQDIEAPGGEDDGPESSYQISFNLNFFRPSTFALESAHASTTITVIAQWRVKEGHLDDVLAHVAELRTASLDEPGCLEYAVFRSIEASDELLLVERYSDATAVEAHRQSPHYGALVVEGILLLRVDRRVELLQPCQPRPHHP